MIVIVGRLRVPEIGAELVRLDGADRKPVMLVRLAQRPSVRFWSRSIMRTCAPLNASAEATAAHVVDAALRGRKSKNYESLKMDL